VKVRVFQRVQKNLNRKEKPYMYHKNMTTFNRHTANNYPCFSGKGIKMQPSFVWANNIEDTNKMDNVRKKFIE
jgi:hypothetical protein